MITHVIFPLTVGSNPTRQIEVNLPVESNEVMTFNKTASSNYPLPDFIACCEGQAKAMMLICEESRSVIDCHIGGLMASLMSVYSKQETFQSNLLDMHIDCFCYLMKADGFRNDEIEKMRPHIMKTISELYNTSIKR